MKTNTFAASTIRVESETEGRQRCPVSGCASSEYTGMAFAVLVIPLALGSCIAVPLFALLVPLLVYRLLHEERTLRRDLRGYSEYCNQISFRLVPWVW